MLKNSETRSLNFLEIFVFQNTNFEFSKTKSVPRNLKKVFQNTNFEFS